MITALDSSVSYSDNSFFVSRKHLFFWSDLGVVTASIIASPEVLPDYLLVSTDSLYKIGGKDSASDNMPHSEGTSASSIHAHTLISSCCPYSNTRGPPGILVYKG